jgi:hypothetical protein
MAYGLGWKLWMWWRHTRLNLRFNAGWAWRRLKVWLRPEQPRLSKIMVGRDPIRQLERNLMLRNNVCPNCGKKLAMGYSMMIGDDWCRHLTQEELDA